VPFRGTLVCFRRDGTPLVSELGLRFIFAVLFLSGLSFLGLGVQPPDADWGAMVRENKEGIVFGIQVPRHEGLLHAERF
jgi:ABC-type antimicrobial peptide transport system permease subunit